MEPREGEEKMTPFSCYNWQARETNDFQVGLGLQAGNADSSLQLVNKTPRLPTLNYRNGGMSSAQCNAYHHFDLVKQANTQRKSRNMRKIEESSIKSHLSTVNDIVNDEKRHHDGFTASVQGLLAEELKTRMSSRNSGSSAVQTEDSTRRRMASPMCS